MLCCALGATVIATGAVSAGSVLRALRSRWAAPAALALAAIGAAGFAAHHLEHYAARAEVNGRDLIAEIRAMPLCTGNPARR